MHKGKSRKTHITISIDDIIEPDWKQLVPDKIGFVHPEMQATVQTRKILNLVARNYAEDHWRSIVASLKENSTLTIDALELAKQLVLCRLRVEMSSNILFSQGMEFYDVDLERMRPSYASGEMTDAIRIGLVLADALGLTPKMRDKVAKVVKKERPQRGSGAYLKSVQ